MEGLSFPGGKVKDLISLDYCGQQLEDQANYYFLLNKLKHDKHVFIQVSVEAKALFFPIRLNPSSSHIKHRLS